MVVIVRVSGFRLKTYKITIFCWFDRCRQILKMIKNCGIVYFAALSDELGDYYNCDDGCDSDDECAGGVGFVALLNPEVGVVGV